MAGKMEKLPNKKPRAIDGHKPAAAILRNVVDKVYAEAWEAKRRGELVGWSSSKFPIELAKAFDLNVVYPENHAASTAAKKDGLRLCQAAEDMGYDNLVISIKSSDVMMCVKAHELIASQTDHPLHVGITEAGTIISGNIKSAIGLGLILHQGIGDTIRVSLTGDPLEEIKSAKLILKTLGLRQGGVEVVSCPTCGRTQINLIQLANQVENMVADIPLDIKVAVMGCVVNGPGEAKEADIGIAGGIGEGLIIKHGEVFKKVPESELLEALRYELLHWNE